MCVTRVGSSRDGICHLKVAKEGNFAWRKGDKMGWRDE